MKPAQEIIFKTSETAYAVDHGGQIVAWNKAAERDFGYRDTEALGSNCWELLCGKDSFGNQYCCEGCPVRNTAFSNMSVNRFRMSFKTAYHGSKDFSVSALLLRSISGKDVMVHLCRNESSANELPPNGFARNQVPQHNQLGNLSQREHEVLTLLADGSSTNEISMLLCISIYTVRNHVQHILFKLQVNSRLKAISLGRRLGVI